MVDDDRPARSLIGAMVRQLGHDPVLTADGEEAWDEYQRTGADVVLTDWMMPLCDGAELCRRIRRHPVGPYTYVAVITALSDREHALAAVHLGADDHLGKPVDAAALEVRLVVAGRVTALHAELLHYRQSLFQLHQQGLATARTDPLTGLGNRLRMAEDLDTARARAVRHGHSYWLGLCGIDDFEGYTRRHGRPAADEALMAVGEELRRAVRRADSLFRYGGGEFLAVFPEQSVESTVEAAERLRRRVEDLAIPHAGRPGGLLTVTVGVAELDPRRSIEDVLAEAGRALATARSGGGEAVAC